MTMIETETSVNLKEMVRRGQHTLIFVHILKTGGITLGSLLRRHYSGEKTFATFPDAWHPDGSIDAFKALTTEEADRIRLLYGHMGFGFHEKFSVPVSYVTLLRDPVERVISRYFHDRREPKNLLHEEIQAGMSLEAYVRYLTEAARMDNLQTRVIAGNWEKCGYGPCTASMLEEAKRNLRTRFLLAGLTERFDAFYLLLCRKFGWAPLFYRRRNVTRRRPSQADLPTETVALIREYNQYDSELYRYARELFAEQTRRQGMLFPIQVQWFRFRNTVEPHYKKLRSYSLRYYLRNLLLAGANATSKTQEE